MLTVVLYIIGVGLAYRLGFSRGRHWETVTRSVRPRNNR